MIEIEGNMWQTPCDWLCITTNGFIKKNGEAVMGRGCAKEAKELMPYLPALLGMMIKLQGNNVHELTSKNLPLARAYKRLFSFPVKHNWWEEADIDLIGKSCVNLRSMWIKSPGVPIVVIPRPGCGNGKLSWGFVKPLIEDLLPEPEFRVIHLPSENR